MQPDDIISFAAFARQLAEALGLSPDATVEEVINALTPKLAATKEVTPDPRKFVPVDAVAELLEDRNSRIAVMDEQAATAMVERAFEDGQPTGKSRPWTT